MNREEWVEKTLQETGEQVLSRIASETPTPREKTEKRPREEDSPQSQKSQPRNSISIPRRQRQALR